MPHYAKRARRASAGSGNLDQGGGDLDRVFEILALPSVATDP